MDIRTKYLTLINLKPQKGDLLKMTLTNFGDLETIEGRFVRFINGYTVLKTKSGHVKVNVSKLDDVEILERCGELTLIK
jgi:hypothetical protein